MDQSVVYVRKVIEREVAHKASGFILAHNHPSGDPSPSPHDREITEALKTAAAAVGVRFLDHLIIGDGEPFSFKAAGVIGAPLRDGLPETLREPEAVHCPSSEGISCLGLAAECCIVALRMQSQSAS